MMKYYIEDLKNYFPSINFSFLQEEIVKKIIKITDGRLVGGVVRDGLLGIHTEDLDIATSYKPTEVLEILKKNKFKPICTGIEYGTISLFFPKYKIEITSLRKDVETFGRKALVHFGGTWEEDSLRRDFTFNGLFLSIEEDEKIFIYDYHNGIEDLKKGVVRFIRNYETRIREDFLRILRFIRFFIRYSKDFNYKDQVKNFLNFVPSMNLLSRERVLMEINSILTTKKWQLGIEIINYMCISDLFFQKKLLNENPMVGESLENKIIYIFSLVEESIIKKLPFSKKTRTYLLFYQSLLLSFSPQALYRIWSRTKNLEEVNHIMKIYLKIKEKNDLTKVNFPSNLDFENFKKDFPILKETGPERGEEEKNIKILFIKKNILYNKIT